MSRVAIIMIIMGSAVLVACAGGPPPEPRIETKFVDRPVPVSCVPNDMPAKPTYSDTASALKAAPGLEDRYQLLAGNWFVRDARLSLLEGVVSNCARVAPP